ncbi:MAG TPA: oligosaccharide flippase family protein [Solirubrobacteraceae bacterium]
MSTGEPAVAVAPDVDIIDSDGAGPAAIRGGIMRTASLACGMLLSLASTPLLIRHLGDADFGRYSAVLAVVMVVGGLMDGGITTIALRELAVTTDARAREQLMSDLLGMRLVLSAIGVVLATAFSAIAGYGAQLVLGTVFAGFGIVVLASTQTLVGAVLQSRLRFGWASLIELARQLVNATLVIVLALTGAGLLTFLAVPVAAGLVSLVLTAMLVRGIVRLRPAFHPRNWLALVRATLVFAVAIAVNTLYFRVTLVIMSLVASATQTGYFAISYRIMEVLIVVPGLLIGGVFPIISRAAHNDRERFEYAIGRIFELSVLLGALLSLCLLLVAPFAIEVLVGHKHHPSVGVLQIQSVAVLASFVSVAAGFALLSLRRHREMLIATFAPLVCAIVLALVLTPTYGARGAAVTAVCADFALAAAVTALLMRHDGPRLPLSVLPVAFVSGLAGYGAGRLVGVHPLVEALAGGVVFLLMLVALRRFPPELRDLARRRLAH